MAVDRPKDVGYKFSGDCLLKIDEFVKSLILFAPQAILGFTIRLAKLQELGLKPSNSLQFFTPNAS
jgi:hypothetical protein